MGIIITNHARRQCEERGIEVGKVTRAIDKYRKDIERHKELDEVKVVVEKLKYRAFAPDGSNGDLIVAAVTPGDEPIVKTIMYVRSSQAKRKYRKLEG